MTVALRYCTRCVFPSSKPDLWFDAAGVCSACLAYDRRAQIDWPSRREELVKLFAARRDPSAPYDCIVPVSGGKDSHYQTLTALELGLRPLCVTATTDHLSDIGRRNIENLKRQGVDYVEVTPNPLLRCRLNRMALEEVGDISWPEHVLIFTIPVRLAVQMRIPLILWGENSQNEYGGPEVAQHRNVLTRRWLEEFGGLLGLRVADLPALGFRSRDLALYTYPSEEELAVTGVTGLFLGHYLPWDGYHNALYVQAHGFETWPHAVEGSLVNYENLDNLQTGIHDYFKYLKFGFGRVTDIASLHVRRGRLSREEAVRLVREHDGQFPATRLGVPLAAILERLGGTEDWFLTICRRWANAALFATDEAVPRPLFEAA